MTWWERIPILASYFRKNASDISEEKMEEYRMLSSFKPLEIIRLRKVFKEITKGSEEMSVQMFQSIECIKNNPLKERICFCFGFDEEKTSIDFQGFLVGMALFNSPGHREQKLRTAFKIQDFDGDGIINKSDMIKYIKLISGGTLTDSEIDEVAIQVLKETSSDVLQENINFTDFQRVVAPLDFQAKLLLPI